MNPTSPKQTESNEVLVLFFDDIRGSTAMKEEMAARQDEDAFHQLLKEHNALLEEVVTRDGEGVLVKSTGDGFLAVFFRPSVAVERAAEIQERLHGHRHLAVRIGMDMGEVRVVRDGERIVEVYGRHVDWAARTASMADGGHTCVTRSVYTDAYSWITKSRIAWKEHGFYRVKPGEPPLEIFEPYNANLARSMDKLKGERTAGPSSEVTGMPDRLTPAMRTEPAREGRTLRLIQPWEMVARDGRAFAEGGAGMMYWFRVPLGGVCYPEGFRNFLVPALDNPRIAKIRFILDAGVVSKRKVWDELVLPQIQEWADKAGHAWAVETFATGGRIRIETAPPTVVAWVFDDLSAEFTPTFKFLVEDPDTEHTHGQEAQIFLATATRRVRFRDGTQQEIRVPDAVIRVHEDEDRALLHALNMIANQWDTLF